MEFELPHWDEGEATKDELARHSIAIDAAIENLLEAQAKLWEEYRRLTPREQASDFAARIRSAKRTIERLRQAHPEIATLADKEVSQP
jgi:hypothetical protein